MMRRSGRSVSSWGAESCSGRTAPPGVLGSQRPGRRIPFTFRGIALVTEVCQGRRFRAALTAMVFLEARVNIAEKFGEPELLRFHQQVAAMDLEMAPPPVERLRECVPLTTEKDAHVLAAALDCGADYLLSLDPRHLLTPAVQSTGLSLGVMTPGDFLKQMA